MKPRVTQQLVKKSYANVISVGYCSLYYLLRYENPCAYTAGVYGWNADVYGFGGAAIVTGYRPFGKNVSYDLIQKYETAAKEVFDGGLPYEEKKELINALAWDFIRDAVKGVK